ncbi:Thiol-disulfide oxidoreductase ResA [bacterium HR36]|nr:Thiol-disulfide oxidoreductase ResA [bacterium HR36]
MSQRGNGLLAGQVMDAYYQRRPYSLIQVSLADGGEAPREVQTDGQGYFVIQGLKPGQRYKLLAKSRLGERVLTGVTYATPPNVVVNIIVREDLQEDAGQTPPANSVRRHDEPTQPVGNPQSWRVPANDVDKPWAPAGLRHSTPTVPPLQPSSGFSPSNPPPVVPPLVVPAPSVVGQKNQSNTPIQPSANQTVPLAQFSNPVPWPGASPSKPEERPPAPLRVPGCRFLANRLDDFALLDVHGQPFYFRESPARLTILDFWGTWCRPCLLALPHLADLQRRYGSHGLQVIGIAYEDGSLAEQQQRVNFVRQRMGLNYRVLLGAGESCPVKQHFGVQSFPTVVLLDAQGNILWRSEGLDTQQLAQLEYEIRRRLN